MKKEQDDKFLQELTEIKALLPKRYYGLVNFLYPNQFTKNDLYNVIHHGVEDKEVLKALKKVVSKNKIVA